MSEGYRINAERIFQVLAEKAYKKYNRKLEHITTRVPIEWGDEISEIDTVTRPSGIESAICAIVFWALSIEAYVNALIMWRIRIQNTIDPCFDENFQTNTRLRIMDKVRKLDILSEEQLKKLAGLFKARNSFVHYKEDMKYTSATPAHHFYFKKEIMDSYASIYRETITELKKKYPDFPYCDDYIEVWQ